MKMIFLGILIVSLLTLQTIQITIHPSTLKAMAFLQTQQAKALAHAIRARAHYNAVKARANLGLLDHRIIRNIEPGRLGVAHDIDFDSLNLPFQHGANVTGGDYDGMFLPEDTDDVVKFFPLDGKPVTPKKNQKEEVVGIAMERNPRAEIACADRDGNLLQVPLDQLNEFGQLRNSENGNEILGCEWPIEDLSKVTHQDSPSPLSQRSVPQGNPNSMVFLHQNPNTQSRAADPHLQPYSHTHTHTHTYLKGFQQPYQNIQIPNTQIITPGLNLHIVQNQNAAVGPATATIQRGFNTNQINAGVGICGPFPTTNCIWDNRAGHPIAQSTSVTQSQVVQTANKNYLGRPTLGGNAFSQSQSIHQGRRAQNSMLEVEPTDDLDRHLGVPNLGGPTQGGNAFSKSQSIHQGRRAQNSMLEVEPTDEPIEDLDKYLGVPNLELGQDYIDNEKVGTFMTDFSMRAPESPDEFDPNKPQNLQPVVNYIEGHQSDMRRMLHSIESNENMVHHFGLPIESRREIYNDEDMHHDDDRLSTFPVPSLPGNFLELNPEEQRESMQEYLEKEQEKFKETLEDVEESNMHNLATLSTLIDSGITNPLGSHIRHKDQRAEKNNPNNLETEPIVSTQYIEENSMKPNIENHQEITDAMLDADQNLGHIIDIPKRRESDWFLRFSRSLNQTNTSDLDNLLRAEKELINDLKKDAKHDEDLMMIGYVGENVINDLERRQKEVKRHKREIGRTYSLPLNRLLVDPRARLDLPKTMDNIGVVAKNTFEHDNAPLFHVRNMVGSAQDAVLATMKIPTNNFLIPSQYEIVPRERESTLVGDINPSVFSEKIFEQENPADDISSTFHKVGSAIRGSVLSGQEAISHVGQVANHAKSAIHSTRYVAPRLILKQVPAITREPRKKAMLITPRIFDLTSDDQVGNAPEDSKAQFVKVGHLLDAVGLSNPKSKDVRFEKIIMDPKSRLSVYDTPIKLTPSKLLQNILGSMRVEDFRTEENEAENLLGNLQNVRETLGVGGLKNLFDKMKRDLKDVLRESSPKDTKPNNRVEMRNTQTLKHKVNPNQEIVEASMIPENSGQISQKERDQLLWEEQHSVDQDGRNLGPVLGAINPLMFEKLFNESFKVRSSSDPPHSFSSSHDKEDKEDVGTSMKLTEHMLKPFMGHADSKMKDEFFHKYMPDEGSSEDEVTEYETETEVPEWMDIEQGNGIEY